MQQQQLQLQSPELRPGTNAPELYMGENEDIGPQRILRVGNQGKTSRRNYLDLNFDTQIFYTDNATFARAHDRIASAVFVNTAQGAIAPDPYDIGPGKFAPAIGFASQWYNYGDDEVSPLDFDAQTAFINLRYLLGYWQFSLGANYTRLASQSTYTETYNEWLPNLSVQRVLPINDNMAFVVGDAIDYHFTSVPSFTATRNDINDHFDNTVYFTFNWQATSHLVVQPFYRFQYSYYQFDTLAAFKRNDYLSATGIALIYNFNQKISLRTFFNYSTKTTDDRNTPDYDELNGGIGGMLDIRF
ncbi:MAG: hypothetical protein JF609_01160 [Verrucomicrobia bacterium]|nr:hypothetical protein [Verrucomicrobiota bacterium]